MPPAYTVHAQVVDIRVDAPQAGDAFLIDTNVWLWASYHAVAAGPLAPHPYQLRFYPSYLQLARRIGATAFRSGLSLAELAHLIEATERDIYESAVSPIPAKDYRHNLAAERARVVREVRTVWAIVKGMSNTLPATIDDPTTDAALLRFGTQLLDGYDLFLLEAMDASGVAQVLTDDGDYCTVPGIQVFTANQRVVAAATAQGRLLTR